MTIKNLYYVLRSWIFTHANIDIYIFKYIFTHLNKKDKEMSISSQPIPVDFRKELYDYYIPWKISYRISAETENQGVHGGYNKVQVLPTDPEWRFVWRYFHHDKPNKYGIKRIYCIYQKKQQQVFELNLLSMEIEANTFKPTWNKESRVLQRAKAIERWRQTLDVFSPFDVMGSDGIKRSFQEVKILPLWYGGSKSALETIVKPGFANFEKAGEESQNANNGFLESGIYFTNSARYAADICSEGHILLAWVSMREPFPIVGDHTQEDMKVLYAKEAYKDYNAHYVPITSINPSDPFEKNYYPTKEEETPRCDEIVVFQQSQILPCFWIELEVELPCAPSGTPQLVNELIPHLMKLLQNPNIDGDQKLRNYLCIELEILLNKEDDYLEKHKAFYEKLVQILDSQGRVNMQVRNILIATPRTVVGSSTPHDAVTYTPQQTIPHQAITSSSQSDSILFKLEETNITKTNKKKFNIKKHIHRKKHSEKDDGFNKTDSISSKEAVTSDSKDCSSSIAFGKADWEKYFGDIGKEPPLPKNIEKILNKSCSFWPDKKVKETHLLVLIPKTVNGKAFTLDYLEKLIQKPKSGYATKYSFYLDCIKEALGDKSYSSHWVLMTKNVIPCSRAKLQPDGCNLIANHSKKTGLHYELPCELDATTSILMHYVKTGERLYSDEPWTYTYCQDVDNYGVAMVVGGFVSYGLSVGSYSSCYGYGTRGVAGVRKF